MLRFIYRQKRRTLFGAFFVALTVLVFIFDNWGSISTGPFGGFGWLVALLTALVVAIIAVIFFSLFILVFPNWRQLIELFSFIVFIEIILGVAIPGIYSDYWFSPILMFATFMGIYSITYGTALDRFPMWVAWETSRSFKSPKTAQEIWCELLPGKGPLEQHWDTSLHDISADPDDPDTFELRYTHGHSLYEQMTITYLEEDPFSHCKYYFAGDVDPKNSNLVDGTFQIDIAPLDNGGCKVTLTQSRKSLLPRLGLALWFDDYTGGEADFLYAKHNGKRDWSLPGKYRRKVRQLA